jgi:hypothetical protein
VQVSATNGGGGDPDHAWQLTRQNR